MLRRLIELSLQHRSAVLLSVLVLIAGGGYALTQLDIDAFPDTTPIMVQVNTTAASLGPEEIERQITYPIEQSLSGLPSLENIRSVSKFGFSQVVVTFEDGTDIYFARQVVGERLATVELPQGVGRPKMGPVATGLGEVFHYTLTYPGVDFSALPREERLRLLTELRTTHDWVVKPQLRTVPGTAEINSWGGYEKQFQVRVDPSGLVSRGLTFAEVISALQTNNRNVGGGNIDRLGEMLLVQGLGANDGHQADREHRYQGRRWRAGSDSRCGHSRDWTRDTPGRSDRRWPWRSCDGARFHVDGRKHSSLHAGVEEQD